MAPPPEGDSLAARLQRAVSWNLAGAAFTSLCNFALTVTAARVLGREQFGEFGMVQTTAVTISGIAQLATGYTATKYVAEFRARDRDRAGRVIGLCSTVAACTAAVATLTVLVAGRWLATESLKAPQLTIALMISSVFVCFATLNGYQSGILAGLESYGAMARALAASSLASLAAAVGGVLAGGLVGLLLGVGVGAAIQWALFRHVVNRECRAHGIRVSYRGVWHERTVALRFALPASLAGLVSMPAAWLANMFLARQPTGFSELGLYNAAASLRSLILFLPLLLNRVSMSLLNHERGRQNEPVFRRLFLLNLGMTTGLILFSVGAVAIAGPYLLGAFGRAFTDGYPVLLIVLAATTFEGMSQAPYQIVQSHERMWLSLGAIALPRDILLVAAAYVLAPRWGAAGLATATALASATGCVSTAMLAWRIGIRTSAEKVVA